MVIGGLACHNRDHAPLGSHEVVELEMYYADTSLARTIIVKHESLVRW